MISILGAETAVDSILEFFVSLSSSIGLDILMVIFVSLMAVVFIASIIRLIWCYESRAIRQMRKINKYLKENPKINDSNLVEFHNKMRHLPRRFRDRWQLFMLEREGSPSKYMTVEYCVKRPLYNSAILTVKKQIAYATVVISILALLTSIAFMAGGTGERLLSVSYLFEILLIPLICALFGCIFCMILHLRYTSVNNSFYDIFTNFIRNIDKSTNSMPDYVDYELLFTPKEINAGIPVLREYLEKRALEEQRLLEKAKQEEANHSPYNFADLGVNGSQLIERAVTESEKFMLSKMQIQQEITDLEKQLQKSEANKEDIEREANKKLQAIKENLERLDKAMAETTNRVEINYNRRQATEEMNKKAKLEKDLENMLAKEQVAIDALKVEIQKRKEIIEQNKEEVETALKSEYDTFSTKVYQELTDKVTRDTSEQMRDLEMVIARLKAKVQEYNKDIEKRDNLVEARSIEVENLRRELLKAKKLLKAGAAKKGKSHMTQEDVDELIKEPPHYEPKDELPSEEPAKKADEFVEETNQPEFVPEQPMAAEFTEEQPMQEEFAPVENGENIYQEMPQEGVYDQQFAEPMEQQYVEQPMYDAQPQDYNMNEYAEPAGYDQFGEQPVEQFAENAPMQQEFVEEQPAQEMPAGDDFAAEFTEPQPQVDETPAEPESDDTHKQGKAGQVKKGAVKLARPGKKSKEKAESSEEKADEDAKKLEEEAKAAEEQKAKEEEAKRLAEEQKAAEEEARKAEEEKRRAEDEAKRAEQDAELKKKMDELHQELQANKKELQEMKEEKAEQKSNEKDELEALQEQINAENERLKKQQEELRAQIDETLKTMEKATNATKAERTRNIKKIKDLISQLKQEAAEAKERGASKAEINKINKSAAELVKVIADYQTNKPISSQNYNK